MSDDYGYVEGDRVVIQSLPDIEWVIASIDPINLTAQLRRDDKLGFSKLKNLKLARTHNKATDTPVRDRRVSEF